nr:tandem-95 repeat protein [Planctomycetota bacterium]
DLDFNGTDSFTYTVTDGIASVTRTVTVTVNAVNDAPVASADSMTTDEDTPGSIILTASDVDEDALTYVATNGANGSVTVVAGVATYTPDENFNGTDSFTFYANDSQVDSNIATVTVNVTPVNDAPVATTTLVTTDEDTSVSFDLTTMVSDPEGDTLTFTVSNGAHGSVLQVGSLVIYTPETNYEGSDSVPFTVTDGIETVAASVAIEVLPVDDSPYVDSDFNGHMVADEMLQVNWALHVTDPDAGDVLSVLAVTWPLPGNVATNNPGTTYVTYIPAMGFTGTDTFNIIITDTTFNVVILPVTITVVPAPSLDMITLAAGSFDMGDHALVGDADELPTHNVSLAEFNVDRNEVRAINYSDYLNTSVTAGTVNLVGSSVYQTGGNSELLFTLNSVVIHDGTEFVVDFADVDMPAVSITWHGAAHYANWVSEKLSLTPCYDETTWSCDFTASGLRLPTEAEFEYASRSGEQTPYFQFPWASDLIDFANANYFGNGVGAVVNVGSYLSNGYGLNDISGNAAEWCNDWYDSGYYSVSPLTNPEGPLTGTLKVTRGGSWNHIAGELRSAARDSGAASTSSDRQGFRLAQKN